MIGPFRPQPLSSQLNTHDTPLIANSTDIVDDADWGWWATINTVVE